MSKYVCICACRRFIACHENWYVEKKARIMIKLSDNRTENRTEESQDGFGDYMLVENDNRRGNIIHKT